MSWQDDLKKIDEVFHQKLRTDATFEWLYVQTIEEANRSPNDCLDVIDGLTQLGKHVALHAQYPIARRLFEKTLDLTEKKIGFESMRAGKLCDNISYCLMMLGKYNEATATIEKWLTASEGKHDKSTAEHRELMSHYSELLYRTGKSVQAREVVQNVLQLTTEKDPLRKSLDEKLVRFETPCQTTFDPVDFEQAQQMGDEMLHGSPASLESLRQAVLEIVVKQAVAGAPWKDVCRGAMEINGITEAEVEAEVNRRRSLIH